MAETPDNGHLYDKLLKKKKCVLKDFTGAVVYL